LLLGLTQAGRAPSPLAGLAEFMLLFAGGAFSDRGTTLLWCMRQVTGAFFGETALLSGWLRQADVVAVKYCQLPVLRQSDFEQFMRENPTARAAIVRVAKAIQLTNTWQDGVGQADL
jgi:CRP-like cAMP-binding protein